MAADARARLAGVCQPHATSLPGPLRRPQAQGGDTLLGGTDLAGLIEDSYSLAEAGQAPITPFLNLLT
jgi:hypothetical protein